MAQLLCTSSKPSSLGDQLFVFPQGHSPLFTILLQLVLNQSLTSRQFGLVPETTKHAFLQSGMDREQQPESSRSPLKKTKPVKIKKKKSVRFLLPQQADKKTKPSSAGDAGHEMFKCKCPYCQACVGSMSGVSVGTRTEATSHSPSTEKQIQDLNNLTLKPRSTQPPVLSEGIQKRENKVHWQLKNKKGFLKVLHKWTA